MNFRTVITLAKSELELTPRKPLLLLGSCFSDNIGGKFREAMWDVAVNPCGVLYNPASIALLIEKSLAGETLTDTDLVERDGQFHSWLFDTHFSAPCKADALCKMNDALTEMRQYLLNSDCLIVTFGTAWIYRLADTDSVVSNCHKFPADTFKRVRLEVNDIIETWNSLIGRLRAVNPTLKIIFTVSPIRHFKDGAYENSLSKATLMLAIDKLRSAFSVDYFPAYELLIDDLRDYRFYADDMLHPSQTAIEYIWQAFSKRYFSQQTLSLIKEAVGLTGLLRHRPITENLEKITTFRKETELRLQTFLQKHPYLRHS